MINDMLVWNIETGEREAIPRLKLAEDYCDLADCDTEQKIAEQTIEFALRLGLGEGDYMLQGSTKAIQTIRNSIAQKNAEQLEIYKSYDKSAQE